MEITNKKKQAWLRFLTALLLCGALLVLVLGSALARYAESTSQEVLLEYEAKSEQVYLRSTVNPENMVIPENACAITFVISNGTGADDVCTYDQIASLSLFATVGLGEPENFRITLTDSGLTYEAKYYKVVEESTLHSLKGDGWVYRFYNEAGEELNWYFEGGQLINREMTLIVEGTSELPTALSLIASAKPGRI